MSYIDNSYELPLYEFNLDKYKPEPIFSKYINFPCLSLGFNQYIYETKDKMKRISNVKRNIYSVVNEFERYIDNYDDDLEHTATKYFSLNKLGFKIIDRAFFKIWEIFIKYKVIDLSKKFTSAHLAEAPGSFIQATMLYRDTFSKNSKTDSYYGITLHSDDESVPVIENEFIKYCNKEKHKRLHIHTTYPKKIAEHDKNKDDGDLTNIKTINSFSGEVVNVDLCTADGGFDWKNENAQEQECMKLLFGQFLTALKVLKKGGNFICKIFETFTTSTLKLIFVTSQMFDKVYIYKPFMSRPSNSEKYIIFKDYEPNKQIISIFEKVLIEFDNNFLIDFFPSLKIPEKIIEVFVDLNIKILNNQVIHINKIINFINAKNYKGEEYEKYRSNQIEATKFWISKFLN